MNGLSLRMQYDGFLRTVMAKEYGAIEYGGLPRGETSA